MYVYIYLTFTKFTILKDSPYLGLWGIEGGTNKPTHLPVSLL